MGLGGANEQAFEHLVESGASLYVTSQIEKGLPSLPTATAIDDPITAGSCRLIDSVLRATSDNHSI